MAYSKKTTKKSKKSPTKTYHRDAPAAKEQRTEKKAKKAKATAHYLLVRDTSPVLFKALSKFAKTEGLTKSAMVRNILATTLKDQGLIKSASRWI